MDCNSASPSFIWLETLCAYTREDMVYMHCAVLMMDLPSTMNAISQVSPQIQRHFVHHLSYHQTQQISSCVPSSAELANYYPLVVHHILACVDLTCMMTRIQPAHASPCFNVCRSRWFLHTQSQTLTFGHHFKVAIAALDSHHFPKITLHMKNNWNLTAGRLKNSRQGTVAYIGMLYLCQPRLLYSICSFALNPLKL